MVVNESVAVKIKDLSKHFGKVKALDGVTVDVARGKIFGFLGPNGAGKTTAIRCLMSYISPFSGDIELFGENLLDLKPDYKNRIGYLSSEGVYYGHWTSRQHISYVESVRGMKTNAMSLASRLGLDVDTKVRKLSTGNKQKLGLVLALMHEPELLILDEPTNGLDPLLQREFYAILREARAKGTTVFMSSHNLAEVEQVCDEVAIIKSGKIIASDTIESLRKMQTRVIRLVFEREFKHSDFEYSNVEIVHANSTELVANVTGDFNTFLGAALKYKIRDIDIGHATLEDVFMRYYNA